MTTKASLALGRHRSSLLIVAAFTVIATVYACGSGGTPAPQAGPRRTMLRDVTAVVILPSYERLVAAADDLAAAAAALEQALSPPTLDAARTAWRSARSAWKQSEAFAIGPAETLRSAAKFDWSPIRPDRLEREIEGAAVLDAAYVEDLGANVKGFLAIEYLLFDPDNRDDAVLAQLAAPRRRAYLRALADNLRDQTVRLRDAWSPSGGDFAAQLATAGQGSAAYATVKSAVDDLVNRLIFLSEDIADAQLLAALGTRSRGEPRPELLDAHRSRNGLADLLDNLVGIQNVYFCAYDGRQGAGFDDVVINVSPSADGAIVVTLQAAIDSAARIPVPLEEAVASERVLVERAQVRAKQLMARLEIDLITVLGSTLRFNPSDGD
jgi:predicted lipoprotein